MLETKRKHLTIRNVAASMKQDKTKRGHHRQKGKAENRGPKHTNLLYIKVAKTIRADSSGEEAVCNTML